VHYGGGSHEHTDHDGTLGWDVELAPTLDAPDPSAACPRDCGVSTVIQKNNGCLSLDGPHRLEM
jgi:hypothetical protein